MILQFRRKIVRFMSTLIKDVVFKTIDNKGIIILNRPEALNALNLSMLEKIYHTLETWESDKTFVIVKSAGGKAFCTGGDIKDAALNSTLGLTIIKHLYTLSGFIGTYKIPYIVLVDGIAMGGGVGLYAHGRYRVATEKTVLAMPETQIGHFPDVGASYFLPRLKGKLGLLMGLVGYRLKGAELLEAGLATHYVESRSLEDLEKDLLACDADLKKIEKAIAKYSVEGDSSGLRTIWDRIDTCFSADSVEGIILNLEKDRSQWGQEIKTHLSKMSPTSLKVTMKQLEYGSKMTLAECLRMEYRIAKKTIPNHNFYEGVRALLIDKDQTPKWKPASLSEVTPTHVESYFSKLPEQDELQPRL